MGSTLRDYQETIVQGVYRAWDDKLKKVMPVAPTGAGTTVISGRIILDFNEATCATAHRAELVSQKSLALAAEGIRHRIIGPEKLSRMISRLHINKFQADYVNPRARVAVAGIDTLIKLSPNDDVFKSWLIDFDEGHHVLKKNKWGKGVAMFRPDVFGIFPTATPTRSDGCGLGDHADGVVERLVEGPDLRTLIARGFLTDYDIACPPSDLDMSAVGVGANGDFNFDQMREAVKKSHIVGDVVDNYIKLAPSKLAVCFAADIETATDISRRFNERGVKSEVVTGETPADLRAAILDRFARREIQVLCNVDLFGEGFDLPAIECVIMARPTQSFSLYSQQFGRALRLMIEDFLQKLWASFSDAERLAQIAASKKPRALIIDHVSNVIRHRGPPDRPRVWTLDRREKRAKNDVDDVLPLKVCVKCTGPYTRDLTACPYCAHVDVPAVRSTPEHVDGDLILLDPEILSKMRGEVARIDGPARVPQHLDGAAVRAVHNAHFKRQQAQGELRRIMSIYGGYQLTLGVSESQCMKRFYLSFGIDTLSAQALNTADAQALTEKIKNALTIDGIVSSA